MCLMGSQGSNVSSGGQTLIRLGAQATLLVLSYCISWFQHTGMCPKDCPDEMANSLDPDQTGSTLFAQTCLSEGEYFGPLKFIL